MVRTSTFCQIGTSDDLEPQIRREYLRSLSRICDRQALIPRSLEIPLCYDPTGNPLFVVDPWTCGKGQHNGQKVAARVLRIWPGDDTEKIKNVSCC
jgi:hypothetical protein